MNNDFSWFDLKNYELSKEFNLYQWYIEVTARSSILFYHGKDVDWRKNSYESIVTEIKEKPISLHCRCDSEIGRWKDIRNIDPTIRYSVQLTPAYEYMDFDKSRYFNEDVSIDNCFDTEELRQKVSVPLNLLDLDLGMTPHFMNVTVDLAATNEQILDDFKSVLSGYREISKYDPPLKNFTPKKMKEWYEKKLLPYCDLLIVSKYQNYKMTQASMANLLFRNEPDVDTVLRLRRTTIPNANYLFDEKTHRAMWAQLQSEA